MAQAPDHWSDHWSDRLARFVVDVPVPLAVFDRELRYRAASAAWVDVFGLPPAPLVGHRHGELLRAGRDALEKVQRRALAGEPVDNGRIAGNRRLRGACFLVARPHRDAEGTILGIVMGLRQAPAGSGDEAASPATDRLTDALTGLADRTAFVGRLQQVMAEPMTERRAALVVVIGLDQFSGLKALLGAALAEQVLRVAAARLVAGTRSQRPEPEDAVVRGGDLVARLGTDAFGILCGMPALSVADAEALAARLLRSVASPLAIAGRSVRPAAVAGFVIIDPAHREPDDVLRDLDLALEEAKAAGPGAVIGWQPRATVNAMRRGSLGQQLRQALDEGEFVVHYEPVVRLADGRMLGAEARLRWNHPSEGLVAAAAFAAVLEETRLAIEVGSWLVREVVRQLETWQVLYGRDIIDWIGIRLWPRQLAAPARLLTTLQAIERSGVPLHRVMLGADGSGLAATTDATALLGFRRLGLRLAFDRFGTGHVRPASLSGGGVDAVRIDGGFVAGIGTPDGDSLAQALLAMAGLYGAPVIAEAVETPAQRDFLRLHGCALGHGPFYAEAMEAALFGTYSLTHAAAGAWPPARHAS